MYFHENVFLFHENVFLLSRWQLLIVLITRETSLLFCFHQTCIFLTFLVYRSFSSWFSTAVYFAERRLAMTLALSRAAAMSWQSRIDRVLTETAADVIHWWRQAVVLYLTTEPLVTAKGSPAVSGVCDSNLFESTRTTRLSSNLWTPTAPNPIDIFLPKSIASPKCQRGIGFLRFRMLIPIS